MFLQDSTQITDGNPAPGYSAITTAQTGAVTAPQSRILIVEDEIPMAKALEIKLKKSGYDAISVTNGNEALVELEKHTYDLILLDIMMPIMDGWSFLEERQRRGIQAKVIVTSNLSQEEDIAKAKELGVHTFLVKSNERLESIVNEVKNLLNE